MELTQKEADRLLQLKKRQSDSKMYQFPARGKKCQVPLTANEGTGEEHFSLDIYQGRRLGIKKMTYQTRGRKIVPLARVDFNGAKHRNPVGQKFPHLIYIYIAKETATYGRPLSPLRISQTLTIRDSPS